MRTLLPICAGLALISGIVSVTMWSELRTERQTSSGLRTQLTDANARIQSLTLAAQNNSGQQAPPVASAANTADARTDAPVPPKAPPAPASAANSLNDYQAREKEMMKDPDYRKARLAQQRMNTERNYPGLVEELGLSQKEADRLFDMLTESEMNRSNELTALFGNNRQPDQAARDEIQRKIQAMQRQEEEQVSALLGPGKSSQFQEYKQTQSGRVQAVQMGTQLAQVGQPLSDVQQRGLTTVMVAEQKRMMQQIQQIQTTARSLNQADPQAVMQLQEQALKIETESKAHILDAAAAHLTQCQIASLKQQFENEAIMNQAQMRAERKRMEAQAAGQTP